MTRVSQKQMVLFLFPLSLVDIGEYDTFYPSTSHPTDQWLHIALTFDVQTNVVIGYRDGEQVGSNIADGIPRLVYVYNGQLVIGRSYNQVHDRYTSVTLDELMFYDRPLNQTEIQSIMTSYGNVTAYDNWKINKPKKQIVIDHVRSTRKSNVLTGICRGRVHLVLVLPEGEGRSWMPWPGDPTPAPPPPRLR